tara:strand:- start:6585 stop:7430 length:846 start_codon:yes stop_codon:yes gene_type:complete
MEQQGIFEPSCEMIGKTIYCSIDTDIEHSEFAFYVNLNGERKATFWYTDRPSIEYSCGDDIIYDFEIVFFIRTNGEKIISKTIKKKTSWSIGDGILEAVRTLLTKESNILELGSGIGSKSLAEICTVYSVEHDSRFLNIHDSVNYINSPLVEIKPFGEFGDTKSYDFNMIDNDLLKTIDMVIVDGPPENYGRSGLLHNLDMFNDNCIWIVDDVLRTKDQKLANYIALHFKLIQYRFWNFSILIKNPIEHEMLQKINSKSLDELNSKSETYMKNYYPSMFKD